MGVGLGGSFAYTATRWPSQNILFNGDFRDIINGSTGCPVGWFSNDVTFDTSAAEAHEPGGHIIQATFAQDGYLKQYFGLAPTASYTLNPLITMLEDNSGFVTFAGWFKDQSGLNNNITLGIQYDINPSAPVTKEVSFTAPDSWALHGTSLPFGSASALREVVGYIVAPDAAGADIYIADFRGGINDGNLRNSDAVYGCGHFKNSLSLPYFYTTSLTFGFPGTVSNNTFFDQHGVTTTATLQPAPGKRGFIYGLTLEPGSAPAGDETFQVQIAGTAVLSATYVQATGGRQTTLLNFSTGAANLLTETDGVTIQCLTADGVSAGGDYLATVHMVNWT